MTKKRKNSNDGDFIETVAYLIAFIIITIKTFSWVFIIIINIVIAFINLIIFTINLFKKNNKISYVKYYTGEKNKAKPIECETIYFNGTTKSNESNSSTDELEKQMDAYELEEWQKELVRQGKYDPWDFEEDGPLEDDDYYYEDDK